MGSCWSGASNDDTADKTLSGKDAITEADVKVIAVGRSENLGGQPSKDGQRTLLHARDANCEEEADPFCRLCCFVSIFPAPLYQTRHAFDENVSTYLSQNITTHNPSLLLEV